MSIDIETQSSQPKGEEIHMPDPSALPILLALTITGVVVTVASYWYLSVASGLLTLWIIVKWIRSTREDIRHLPPGH